MTIRRQGRYPDRPGPAEQRVIGAHGGASPEAALAPSEPPRWGRWARCRRPVRRRRLRAV